MKERDNSQKEIQTVRLSGNSEIDSWLKDSLLEYRDEEDTRVYDLGPGSETRRVVKDMLSPGLDVLAVRSLQKYAELMGRGGELPDRYSRISQADLVETGKLLEENSGGKELRLTDGKRDLRPGYSSEFLTGEEDTPGEKVEKHYLAVGLDAYILAEELPLAKTYNQVLETNNFSGI